MIDLTIIIVTYNSAGLMRDCLESLRRHWPQRYGAQLVVVDNASQDDTAAIILAEFPEVRLLQSPENLGFGRGNNLGMQAAPARYYYLHNPDARLQGDSLDEALDILEVQPEIGVAGLPLVFPDLRPQTAAYAFTGPLKWVLQGLAVPRLARAVAVSQRLGWLRAGLRRLPMARSFLQTHAGGDFPMPQSREVDWVCGAALILREAVRADLGGGFDPAMFLYGEDEDLCIEARKNGWGVAQLGVTPVIHEFGWGSAGKASPDVARLKAESLKVFINKHFHRGSPRWAAMRALLWLKKRRWGVKD
jgi:hypothetical protein